MNLEKRYQPSAVHRHCPWLRALVLRRIADVQSIDQLFKSNWSMKTKEIFKTVNKSGLKYQSSEELVMKQR